MNAQITIGAKVNYKGHICEVIEINGETANLQYDAIPFLPVYVIGININLLKLA